MRAKMKHEVRGCYYHSQNCKYCGKLITGESEESRKKARTDFYYRMREHGQDYHPDLTEGGSLE